VAAMNSINILVLPCGSEIGLEIHKALKDIRFITLFGGSGVQDHGAFAYRNYIGDIPFITDPGCIPRLNEVIDKYKIDFIFPAMDSVIAELSSRREALHASLLTSPDDAVQVCRSKAKTYDRLSGCDFLPTVYSSVEQVDRYPVIIKPAESQGGQGVAICHTAHELSYRLASRTTQQVICQYLPGEEYTVDCFTDRHGALRMVSCRSRDRVKSGISVHSSLTPPDPRVEQIAAFINGKMRFRGAWFFQLKKDTAGDYRLLECATRIAGTMCVERAAGVNLALLTVFDAMEMELEIPRQLPQVTVDRALHNTYRLGITYDEAYIDYDDTLICHDKPNLAVLSFIYQCVQKGVKVILLTRHDTDVRQDMVKYRIFPQLFDEIICLPRSEKKTDHVAPSPRAIFLDDSFAERKAMSGRFGIPTFGVDGVEALLDERQ